MKIVGAVESGWMSVDLRELARALAELRRQAPERFGPATRTATRTATHRP